MKFTRSPMYSDGEVEESELCGIGALLITNFKKRIPNADTVRFSSIFEIDEFNNVYQVKLEQYGVPDEEVSEFMRQFSCETLEEKVTK